MDREPGGYSPWGRTESDTTAAAEYAPAHCDGGRVTRKADALHCGGGRIAGWRGLAEQASGAMFAHAHCDGGRVTGAIFAPAHCDGGRVARMADASPGWRTRRPDGGAWLSKPLEPPP